MWRSALNAAAKAAVAPFARLVDDRYLATDVPSPVIGIHPFLPDRVVEAGDRPGFRVLEIGSRKVTHASALRHRFKHADYVGIDNYQGENVDIVGDAHQLEKYFDRQFDVMYSSAVFEHLAMPWLVAEQISKTLKVGGTIFIETHFSASSHERPWNFFQFSDMGLRVLFNEALGFQCIEAGMQTPIVGRYSRHAAPYLRYRPVKGLYCHSTYVGRKVRDISDFNWRDVDLDQLVNQTRYPAPSDSNNLR